MPGRLRPFRPNRQEGGLWQVHTPSLYQRMGADWEKVLDRRFREAGISAERNGAEGRKFKKVAILRSEAFLKLYGFLWGMTDTHGGKKNVRI